MSVPRTVAEVLTEHVTLEVEGIGGGARFAFESARSGGVARVCAIGLDLSIGGHGIVLAPGNQGKCGRKGGGSGFSARWLRELEKFIFGSMSP